MRELVEVITFGFIQLKGASQSVHNLIRRSSRPALLESHQVIHGDSGKRRQLLASQSRDAALTDLRQSCV